MEEKSGSLHFASVGMTNLLNGLKTQYNRVFITLGEPQAHGDTAKAVPFHRDL